MKLKLTTTILLITSLSSLAQSRITQHKKENKNNVVFIIIEESSLRIVTSIAITCKDINDTWLKVTDGTKFLLQDEKKANELLEIIERSKVSTIDEDLDVRAKISIHYQLGKYDILCIGPSRKYYMLNERRMEFENEDSAFRAWKIIWGENPGRR